jgi:CNT family concentrative nucleoside transporter
MELIPNAGLSLISLSRGLFGMFFLIFIAYLFSNNRNAIAWKTVGIGLIIQVFIAIGVLKINFVKGVFETIGGFFIKVLEYTGEGTKMLLGEFGKYGDLWIYFCLSGSSGYYLFFCIKFYLILFWDYTKVSWLSRMGINKNLQSLRS